MANVKASITKLRKTPRDTNLTGDDWAVICEQLGVYEQFPTFRRAVEFFWVLQRPSRLEELKRQFIIEVPALAPSRQGAGGGDHICVSCNERMYMACNGLFGCRNFACPGRAKS